MIRIARQNVYGPEDQEARIPAEWHRAGNLKQRGRKLPGIGIDIVGRVTPDGRVIFDRDTKPAARARKAA
jgi:hypothetical protein